MGGTTQWQPTYISESKPQFGMLQTASKQIRHARVEQRPVGDGTAPRMHVCLLPHIEDKPRNQMSLGYKNRASVNLFGTVLARWRGHDGLSIRPEWVHCVATMSAVFFAKSDKLSKLCDIITSLKAADPRAYPFLYESFLSVLPRCVLCHLPAQAKLCNYKRTSLNYGISQASCKSHQRPPGAT